MDERTGWGEHRAEELVALAKADAIVLVPVAAMEQHGPHLPVATDTLIGREVGRRTALALRRRGIPCIATDPVWSGLSEHHMSFGGTITLDFATFQAVIRHICRSAHRHGFRRLCIVNSHGGNIQAVKTIADELTFELGCPVLATTAWLLAEPALAPILERQGGVRHACEAETSMIMAIAPHLVDETRLLEADCPDPRDEGGPAPGELYRWRAIRERTPSGCIGIASAGTAAKGEKLLDACADTLAAALAEPATWAPIGPR